MQNEEEEEEGNYKPILNNQTISNTISNKSYIRINSLFDLVDVNANVVLNPVDNNLLIDNHDDREKRKVSTNDVSSLF